LRYSRPSQFGSTNRIFNGRLLSHARRRGCRVEPLAAGAQQPERMRRIGVLGPSLSNPFPSTVYQAFLAQLRELGFSEVKISSLNIKRWTMHADPSWLRLN
jgi:hypothetical protein